MTARASLRLLHVVLGLVLCAYSAGLVAAQASALRHSHASYLLLILGAVEAVAALLFLWPPTLLAGGVLLLATFAAAAAIHVLQGPISGVGTLAIYAAAVLTVMNGGRGA